MSRLQFRNVDAEPTDPVGTWPYEGLVAAIERGALSDWQRIAAELRAEPWGRIAASLDDYLGYADEDGVTALLGDALERARAAARDDATLAVASRVRELVASSGLTRGEFAARADTSASRLSTYCTGKVTPSAALMLRFEQVASSARAEPKPPTGSDATPPPTRP